jgi:glucokinase
MADCYIGIDLGGTNIKAGAVDRTGRSLSRVSHSTESRTGYRGVVERIAEAARCAAREAGVDLAAVRGVCLASPGVITIASGIVHVSPNLPGWSEVPLAGDVGAALGREVILENDANAAAWGEFWVGAGRNVDSMVMLTLGTGVGGGIVLNGRVWHGAQDSAGEIGHMLIKEGGRRCGCGRLGCLEAYASVTALSGRFVEAVLAGEASSLAAAVRAGRTPTGREICDAAAQGDPLAQRLMQETAYYLGVGIVNICHVLNPERVVLTGGMTAAGERILGPVRRTVREMAFAAMAEKMEIVFAALGEDAGYIGAAGMAIQADERGNRD